MDSLLKKYGIPLPYEDGLPVIPDILPAPNYNENDLIAERYKVKELHHGAAGDVYRCLDTKRNVDVALKTVIGHNKSDRSKMLSFYHEIEQRLRLPTHPNVLSLQGIENIDGYYFIISEWVASDDEYGSSMTEWLSHHLFSTTEIVNFMQQMCCGLAHCHKSLSGGDKPYAFGDLKPDNILIAENHIFKLADFSGGYTPGWNAPEQNAGSSISPDVRTDIFCLGKIASVMLTTVPDLDDEFRDAVDSLLRKCLHPKMEKRVQSLSELSEELDALCSQFHCESYVVLNREANTFMDHYNRLVSKANLGHYVSPVLSLSDQAYARSLMSKKYLSMSEYMEFTKGDGRLIHQALVYYNQGDLPKAIKTLQDRIIITSSSVELYYRLATFLYAAGRVEEALWNLNAAILKELYLPACDFKVNILLDFPQFFPAYRAETGVMLDKLQKLPGSRFVGYLLNQVIGKYYMLANMNEYAASYFRKSLQYINLNDEWLTLYYYALCEFRLGESEKARTICSQAIQIIPKDPRYAEKLKECTILLFCNHMICNLPEVRRLAEHIKRSFGVDYSRMVTELEGKQKAGE